MSQGWNIRGERVQPLQALIALWLSAIFVLYMAPTAAKYQAADLLAVALLMLAWVSIGVFRSGFASVIKPVAPVLAILAYVVAQEFGRGGGGAWPYMQQLLYGFG